MLNFLNIKKPKEEIQYNFWLTEEIEKCKLFGKDLTKFITPDTHPVHAQWISKALINGVSKQNVEKIAKVKFKLDESIEKFEYVGEEKIEKMYYEYLEKPELEDFLENYKPDIIKQGVKESNYWKGAVIGDIIGEKYEFVEHDETVINYKGHFTDDSVLTVATIKAIKENPDKPDFRKWYLKGYKDFPDAGYGGTFIRWAIGKDINNKIGYGSYANGSAMRVSPVGYYYENIEDVIKYAYQSSMVTHSHVEGVKGAVVTAVVCWMCKNNYSKDEIKEYVKKHYSYSEKQLEFLENSNNIFDIDKGYNNNFTGNLSLFANYAVPYATFCFIESNNFEDCMEKVLAKFCDADTVCAIAGSFAAGFYKKDFEFEKYENLKELKNWK